MGNANIFHHESVGGRMGVRMFKSSAVELYEIYKLNMQMGAARRTSPLGSSFLDLLISYWIIWETLTYFIMKVWGDGWVCECSSLVPLSYMRSIK